MTNPWFRFYSEFSHDPKVQMMTEAMQRRYIMVMCLRCSNALVTLHETEIAFHLRITDAELAETKALFIAKGFVDDKWNLLNWDKRQFVSDSSAERVKRHRAKRAEQGLPQQNAIRSEVRYAVYKRDGNACIYCGNTEDLTIDHDMPQSRGGSDEIDNLLTACRACNASKRDLTHDEYCERNGLVTLLKRKANVVDTEQIQRTDTDKNKIKSKSATATRLPADWKPSADDLAFCKTSRPELNPFDVADAFCDYWIAQAGAKGRKADWSATWRNWVRNQRQVQARASPGYESAKDRSRREFTESIFGKAKNESTGEHDITGFAERVD